MSKPKVGDVVQIDPDSPGLFGGCFLLVTEEFSWGVEGFVLVPEHRGVKPRPAYYRAALDEVKLIGRAAWVPAEP